MTADDGNFLLSVPIGGTMTFIENGNVWTFQDIANNAQAYTTAQVTAASSTATAQINAAIATAEVTTMLNSHFIRCNHIDSTGVFDGSQQCCHGPNINTDGSAQPVAFHIGELC